MPSRASSCFAGAWRAATVGSGAISPTRSSSVWRLPSRQIAMCARLPGLAAATSRGSSFGSSILSPFHSSTTSPTRTPPFSAGPPFSTLMMIAPVASSSLNERASSLVTGWIAMPTRPRVTLPWLCSWRETSSATSIGMAKDTPM